MKQALRPEKYAEVVAAFGEFPGEYMSTADGKLGGIPHTVRERGHYAAAGSRRWG